MACLKDCIPEEEARLDAELLLAHVLGVDRFHLYTRDCACLLGKKEAEHFRHLVERRKLGESVAYITGEKEFWSRSFRVGKGCLVPRPETEILVEQALEFIKRRKAGGPLSILDLGTGSGCVGVVLGVELGADGFDPLMIVATDISKDALGFACENVLRHGVQDRVRLVLGDWLQPFKADSFDLIVANPPYISPDEYRMLAREVLSEPEIALIGGEDGLFFIRETLKKGPRLLRDGGAILMEMGAGQVSWALSVLSDELENFKEVSVAKDLAGIDRVLVLEL